MRLEDRGELLADPARGLSRVPPELLRREPGRAPQTALLLGELVGGDGAPKRAEAREADDDGASDRDARGRREGPGA